MVNELNNYGSAYARTTPRAGAELPAVVAAAPEQAKPPVKSAVEQAPQQAAAVNIDAKGKSYAEMLGTKAALNETSNAVRQANQALDQVDAVLTKIQEKVSSVKNYPPFPEGNEERVQYLNSIDGLRKELQAMTIPPVSEAFPPVFYPQEAKFPPLDAKFPSDAAVLAFGEAAFGLQQQADTAREVLKAQMEKSQAEAIPQLPRPVEESAVPAISASVGTQLAGVRLPIAGNSDVLSQIGQ